MKERENIPDYVEFCESRLTHLNPFVPLYLKVMERTIILNAILILCPFHYWILHGTTTEIDRISNRFESTIKRILLLLHFLRLFYHGIKMDIMWRHAFFTKMNTLKAHTQLLHKFFIFCFCFLLKWKKQLYANFWYLFAGSIQLWINCSSATTAASTYHWYE